MKLTAKTPTILTILFLGFVLLNLCGALSSVQAQQVQVTTADPPATAQGTINLNVKVTGKGFKNGAKARWFVTGTTDPGGVTVNSTAFVSSTELTANITVADTAVIANFDIQVLNSDGRGGKGTELFAVTAKGGGTGSCPALAPAPTSDTKCYFALPGCLDTTFGFNGLVTTDPDGPTHNTSYGGVVVQPDGKIIVTGQALASGSTGTNLDFLVLRYNVDGSLDTSFGDSDQFNSGLRLGYVITPFTTGPEFTRAVLLQTDSKIVVAGQSAGVYNGQNDPTNGLGGMAVARYNTDGTLDSSFGSGGKVIVYFNNSASAFGMAIQSDGRLVLAGSSANQFVVARLNTNGSLDTSFGSNGKLSINPSESKHGGGFAWTVAIQRVPAITGEERIVLGGRADTKLTNGSTVWAFTVIRLKPNGAIDTTFGSSGRVYTTFFGFSDDLRELAIDSSNRIVAAGIVYTANSQCGMYAIDFGVVRYTQDGSLDVSFSGGKQTADIYGGTDDFQGLVLQTDGRLVIAGTARSSDNSVTDFALVRFNADGSRDSTFGLLGNGIVTTDFHGTTDWGYAITIQPTDGKILLSGGVETTLGGSDVGVARYRP
jgi:uncharacterized delta-60 repeat protein